MATPVKSTSSNAENRRLLERHCVLNDVLARIALRWKMQVLYGVQEGHASFASLQRALPTLSDHVLAKRLRELVDEGLLRELIGPSATRGATRKRYVLTEPARELMAICQSLCAWETANRGPER